MSVVFLVVFFVVHGWLSTLLFHFLLKVEERNDMDAHDHVVEVVSGRQLLGFVRCEVAPLRVEVGDDAREEEDEKEGPGGDKDGEGEDKDKVVSTRTSTRAARRNEEEEEEEGEEIAQGVRQQQQQQQSLATGTKAHWQDSTYECR
jgi:hypothetical protein